MPNINLIAQKRHEKARLERLVRRLFFLASSLAIVGILTGLVLSANYYKLKGDISLLENQMQELEPKITELQKIDRETAALRPKINLYGDARAHTLRWYYYLQVVARSLPENTWLTGINTTSGQGQQQAGAPPETATVSISGTTISQRLVGETMLTFNRYTDLMDKVDLQSTKEELEGTVPVVKFQLSTSIKDMPAIFTDEPAAPKDGGQAQGGANANQAKS